jgi:hypothetical protein
MCGSGKLQRARLTELLTKLLRRVPKNERRTIMIVVYATRTYNQEIVFLSETFHRGGGPGKLRAFWEEEVHVVVSGKGPESPVYELRPETERGRNRVLHRNLLLPCAPAIRN